MVQATVGQLVVAACTHLTAVSHQLDVWMDSQVETCALAFMFNIQLHQFKGLALYIYCNSKYVG